MSLTRIKLISNSYPSLEDVCRKIVEISKQSGVKYSGPIPLPTKRLNVTTRKSNCGGGTESYARFEMRIHKRLLDVEASETALRQIMRVPIPKDVHVSLELKA